MLLKALLTVCRENKMQIVGQLQNKVHFITWQHKKITHLPFDQFVANGVRSSREPKIPEHVVQCSHRCSKQILGEHHAYNLCQYTVGMYVSLDPEIKTRHCLNKFYNEEKKKTQLQDFEICLNS